MTLLCSALDCQEGREERWQIRALAFLFCPAPLFMECGMQMEGGSKRCSGGAWWLRHSSASLLTGPGHTDGHGQALNEIGMILGLAQGKPPESPGKGTPLTRCIASDRDYRCRGKLTRHARGSQDLAVLAKARLPWR